jgi:predicted metal-dependent hydrolase
MEQYILFGSKKIAFTLTLHTRKSLTIKVNPDASVEVLAPIISDKQDIIQKIKSKAPWILKQIEKFNSYKPGTPYRKFINGETHLYLGRQYRLKIVPDNTNVIKAYRGQLFIHATDTSKQALEKQLQEWYKEKAINLFEQMLKEVIPKFKKYNINNPTLYIRAMTKRWGSCTPSGKIILNTELIKASKGCIEYVIIHELSHLVYYSHNKAFYALQNRIMPDWEKWKDRLEYSLS